MNELDRERRLLLLRCMVTGNGIRDCAVIVQCDPGTVQRHLRIFGEAFKALHDELVRGLVCKRLELDEVWAFVYGKSRNKKRFSDKAPRWAGDYFTWTALDPDTKLLVSWHVSKRRWREALRFLFDLRSRVVGRVLITTDALPVYKRAIAFTFGADADHVRIEKVLRSRWNRETGDRQVIVVSITKKLEKGDETVDLGPASTSHNERHNGTIRNFISRFHRYTYGFSKKLDNHIYAHAIYSAYYNFVKKHRSLGELTPAIQAQITKKIWTFDDLLDYVDAYWVRRAEGQPSLASTLDHEQFVPLQPGVGDATAAFFVCHDTAKDTAKVHAGPCRNCRFGIGRGGGGLTSTWYAFGDQTRAEAAAEKLAPEDHSVCAICITREYRKRSRLFTRG